MNPHILVVEDDMHLLEYLRNYLNENGFLVRQATDGVEALEMIEKTEPDIVILDLELPKLKGETVCRELRKNYPQIPVVILTARDSVSEVVEGLNLGADDYITKPFEGEELLARIRAHLRRTQQTDTTMRVGDLVLDRSTLSVTRGKSSIHLTPQEYRLLEYLVMNKGRVLTREMILSRLWQGNPDVETRVVDVYIGYLRKKIDSSHKQKLIHSIRGFGYKADAGTKLRLRLHE